MEKQYNSKFVQLNEKHFKKIDNMKKKVTVVKVAKPPKKVVNRKKPAY